MGKVAKTVAAVVVIALITLIIVGVANGGTLQSILDWLFDTMSGGAVGAPTIF